MSWIFIADCVEFCFPNWIHCYDVISWRLKS
jgi:hypothetical protein